MLCLVAAEEKHLIYWHILTGKVTVTSYFAELLFTFGMK